MKKQYLTPKIRPIEIAETDVICDSDASTQSYEAEEDNPWGNS